MEAICGAWMSFIVALNPIISIGIAESTRPIHNADFRGTVSGVKRWPTWECQAELFMVATSP
jgi:hypothetical protein